MTTSDKNSSRDTKADAKSGDDFDFGASMAELEQIVTALEGGELELDAAIRQFERGAGLAEYLQKYLAKTQLKVQSIKAQLDKSESNSDSE